MVLKRPSLQTEALSTLKINEDVMDAKYHRMLMGTKMRATMEAAYELENLEWLQTVAATGITPIHRVIEEVTPNGHMGRLVELKVGETVTQCREIISQFEEGDFNYHKFWEEPLLLVPKDVVPEEEHDDGEDDDLPNVGFSRLQPKKRPSYVGSKRQSIDVRKARIANEEPVEDELDASDEDTDYEEEVEAKKGKKRKGRAKKKKPKPAAELHVLFETREVRCIIGHVKTDRNSIPELWFYCPEHASAKGDKIRWGWWLDVNDDSDGDPELRYIAGPMTAIQRTKKGVFADVGVFPQVNFRRTFERNQKGNEKRGTIRVQYVEPLSAALLGPAMAALEREKNIVKDARAAALEPSQNPDESSEDKDE